MLGLGLTLASASGPQFIGIVAVDEGSIGVEECGKYRRCWWLEVNGVGERGLDVGEKWEILDFDWVSAVLLGGEVVWTVTRFTVLMPISTSNTVAPVFYGS